MNCRQAEGLIQQYVDGRLDTRRASALAAHLHCCERCHADLAALEAICALAADPEPIATPDLSGPIMARIAASETRRGTETARRFGLRWADAKLAAALATATTLLFVLVSPGLRLSLGGQLRGAFPDLAAFLLSPGPGSVPWIALFVWILMGIALTVWFAGAEVRSSWRRAVTEHVPQLPQMRQM